MTRIGLISDTHGFLDPAVLLHLKDCDEIWHAGDFGGMEWVTALQESLLLAGRQPTIRGVYGNIDGQDVKAHFPLQLFFQCEGVDVYMQHIGGYPGKYAPGVKKTIQEKKIKLFISGHSHILKIMYDDALGCLHMNPGAAGNQGWHKVKTIVRFVIDGNDIKDCSVVEF